MEDQLRVIWSRVLECEPEDIDNDTNFFEFGGDSVNAIQVVSEAGSQNIWLDVESLVSHPTIGSLSSYLLQTARRGESRAPSKPQTSSHDKYDDKSIIEEPLSLRALAHRIAPVGPLQQALFDLTKRRILPPSVFVYEIEGKVDEDRVIWALKALTAKHPILRSTWGKTSTGYCQVLLRECEVPCSIVRKNIGDHTRECEATVFGLGEAIARYHLVYTDQGSTFLTITIHHAFNDAYSRTLLERDLVRALRAPEDVERDPTSKWFGDLSFYLVDQLDLPGALEYWRRHIDGAAAEVIFRSPSYLEGVGSIEQVLHRRQDPSLQVGPGAVILAAWSLALAGHSGMDDFIFAFSKLGRNLPYPGIDQILGPMVKMSILRFRTPPSSCSTREFLQDMQRELSRHASYEPGLTPSVTKQLPAMQCRVNIRLGTPGIPRTRVTDGMTIRHRRDLQPSDFVPQLGVYLAVDQHSEGLQLTLKYQRKHIDDDRANTLFNNFAHLLMHISACPRDAPIGEIIKGVDQPGYGVPS